MLRPYTAFKLSLRMPPLVDGNVAAQALKTLLEDNAPYNAKVTFHTDGARATSRPAPPAGTRRASRRGSRTRCNAASQAHFGAPCGYIGQGGTIPLMSMLQQSFPKAQMMVCGVLGPKSNAHGPNEFLHVPYGKKLTAAVAQVMAACPSARVGSRSATADRLGDLDAVDRRRHDPAGIARAFAGRVEAARRSGSGGRCRA